MRGISGYLCYFARSAPLLLLLSGDFGDFRQDLSGHDGAAHKRRVLRRRLHPKPQTLRNQIYVWPASSRNGIIFLIGIFPVIFGCPLIPNIFKIPGPGIRFFFRKKIYPLNRNICEWLVWRNSTWGGYKTGNMCGYKTGIMCRGNECYNTNHLKFFHSIIPRTKDQSLENLLFAQKRLYAEFFTRKFFEWLI